MARTCITPPSKRGSLTIGPQLLVCGALVAMLFMCYGTSSMDSSLSWRTPFIMLACLSFTFAIASFLWLILLGCQLEAATAWDVLEVNLADREHLTLERSDTECRVEDRRFECLTHSSNKEGSASVEQPKSVITRRQFFDPFSCRTEAPLSIVSPFI